MDYMLKHKNRNVAKLEINENTHAIANIVDIYDIKRLPVKIYNQDMANDIVTMNRWLQNRGYQIQEGIYTAHWKNYS
jgi:hypothetical protein